MLSRIKILGLALLVAGLSFINVQLASAHQWGNWHWDKDTLHLLVFGGNQAEAVAAIADWDSNVTDLRLHTQFKNHTDVSVFDGNYGNTGWGGLASIEHHAFTFHCFGWCHILHAHARYNSYYGGTSNHIRGVFCQEVGHTFGLDHSNTGDCMGKGYFNNINVTGPHNWADINSMY